MGRMMSYRGDGCVITIVKNQMMIEQYQEVLRVTSDAITLRLKDRMLSIEGEDLKVSALTKDEILIEGQWKGLQFHEA